MELEHAESPEYAGFSPKGVVNIEDVVRRAIEAGATPGAVVFVARRGKVVLEEAFGRLDYHEKGTETAVDTLYDLASLTKVVVTTTLAMILYEQGKLELDATVASYVPELRGTDKVSITIRDLLAHSAGFVAWTELYKEAEGQEREQAKRTYLASIVSRPLEYEPRTGTTYSDLGVLLLGEVVERITARDLDELAREEILEPLGMDETMYRPSEELLPRIAPTEDDPWRGRVVRGEVHDENAYGLGGVAPHAGLFSTARSLAAFAQMMLNGGAYDGNRILRPGTIALFTQRANLATNSSRALGWDTPSEPSSSGKYFSSSSFGHTGFTGTSFWIDPKRALFAILLTNRVHPTRENRQIYELRKAFHDAVMQAIVDEEILPRKGGRGQKADQGEQE